MAGRKDECFVNVLRVLKDIMHALKAVWLYMPFRTSGVHWTPCLGEWYKKEKKQDLNGLYGQSAVSYPTVMAAIWAHWAPV